MLHLKKEKLKTWNENKDGKKTLMGEHHLRIFVKNRDVESRKREKYLMLDRIVEVATPPENGQGGLVCD